MQSTWAWAMLGKQGQGGGGGGNHPEQPERKTPQLDPCLLHACPALPSHLTLPLGEIPGETGQTLWAATVKE